MNSSQGSGIVTRDVPTLIHDGEAWVRAQHYDDSQGLLREACAEAEQLRHRCEAYGEGRRQREAEIERLREALEASATKTETQVAEVLDTWVWPILDYRDMRGWLREVGEAALIARKALDA